MSAELILDKRREKVRRSPGELNGIDYVRVAEVTQFEGERVALVLLHLLKPAPENADLVAAILVRRGNEFLGVRPSVNTSQSFAEGYSLLVSLPGDTAPATLFLGSIVDPATSRLVPIDPLLNQVEVVFSTASDLTTDCAASDPPEPDLGTSPPLDYRAHDYPGFQRLIYERMAKSLPDWRERSPADLGVTLVEAVAFAADQVAYFQDAVASEAYLHTARRRVSLRRHGRLLDYTPSEGCSARALVCITVATDLVDLKLSSLRVLARLQSDTQVVFAESALADTLRRESERTGPPPQVFEPIIDPALSVRTLLLTPGAGEPDFGPADPGLVTLRAAHNRIALHTFSDSHAALSVGSTSATIVVGELGPSAVELSPGQIVIFEELPLSPAEAGSPSLRRHAVRLLSVGSTQHDLVDGLQVAEIRWGSADALPYTLPLYREQGGRSEPAAVLRGNVLVVDHGHTLTQELPALASSSRELRLPGSPLSFVAALSASASAAELLQPDAQQARPAISVREMAGSPPREFSPRRDLLGSRARDLHFAVEVDDVGGASLRFGDGQQGARPSGPLLARYRLGQGLAGNLPASALAHLVSSERLAELSRSVLQVENLLPAQGGRDPETAEQLRRAVPHAFRRQERAVTEADYIDWARQFRDVRQAAARWRWTGSQQTLYLTVVRQNAAPVDEDFRSELLAFLQEKRLVGHDIEIETPVAVPIDLRLTVFLQPEARKSVVREALRQAFLPTRRPDGRPGVFHPDNLPLGGTLFLSQIVGEIMAIPGVAYVDGSPEETTPFNRFRRFGVVTSDGLVSGRLALSPRELARLDNDAQNPARGRAEFDLRGGL